MAKYVLISLPSTFDSLKATVADNGTVVPFNIPNFKIGTLDALVQQADDLAKLDSACQALVAKVGDSLRTLYDGDDQKASEQKIVNDKPTDQYLRSFTWNTVRYRADKPVGELFNGLQKPVRRQDLVTTDNDVKGKLNQYNQVKTNLTALQRKQTGNLATKSLTPIVDPAALVQDSEYLETHLIAVPTNLRRDFIKSYETLTERVVPRSAVELAHDDEFVLYAVTTFKKNSADFQQKCREQKWTPRQYKYVEGGKEEEKRELERVAREEKKVWGEALRMVHTGWSESIMIWAHAMALRVFVESVLRYGLPLEFVPALVVTNSKLAKKVKGALDTAYSYLGGNAVGRDKRGKITKDDAALTSEIAAAGVGGHGEGNEYTAYVYYEFEL
ncbi:vacuolar ATP synthase-like protein subunit C 1 [Xylaria grammica]|nr:vacuolar ATP synthase-like protein subunit C 1 [Xylaria grammica]